MEFSEKIIFSNTLGIVSDKRVFINKNNELKNFKLEGLISISFEKIQYKFFALIYVLAGIGIIIYQSIEPFFLNMSTVIFMSVLFIMLSIFFFIGHSRITLLTVEKESHRFNLDIGKSLEGRELYDVIKKQIHPKDS